MADNQTCGTGTGEPSGVDRLRRFRAGEPEAVAHVAALVRRVVADPAYQVPRAEQPDLAQEAVLQVFEALIVPGFALRQSFDALVRAIAFRRCIDWLRRRQPVVPIGTQASDPAAGPERLLENKEALARAGEVLRRLSEICRQILHFRVLEDLPHRQIAARLGRSEGGVRNLLSKCLQQARALLGELEQDGGSGR